MNPRSLSRAVAAAAAALLAQACVQVQPAADLQAPSPAQDNAGLPPAPPSPPAAPTEATAGLDRLLGPIALYPDPLIALILPASTVPSDISAAAAYLIQYGDMTRIDSQPWDPSVRSLAHYPPVIEWMADNPAWTQALGAAFLSSPAEVMASIQRLRARAAAAGALASTPQQLMLTEDGEIEILPAQPDLMYVPVYDDDVVYSSEPYYGYGGPFINFGEPFAVGPWLSFCIDWQGQWIWVGRWGEWHGTGGWHRPHFGGGNAPPGIKPWHPHDRPGGLQPPGSPHRGYSAPRPMIGAPNPPPARFRVPPDQAHPQARPPPSGAPSPRTPAPAVGPQGPGAAQAPSKAAPGPSYQYANRPASPAPTYATHIPEAEPREAAPAPGPAPREAPAGRSAPAHESAPASGHETAPATAPSTDPKAH